MKIQITHPNQDEVKKMDFSTWNTWTCKVSEFNWSYHDKETAYLLEGRVRVKTDSEEVEFKKGDMVVFPKGLDCQWKVMEPVKKYYRFG
jgi:uncharacterized protein